MKRLCLFPFLLLPWFAVAQTFTPPIPLNGPIPEFNVPGTLYCQTTPSGIPNGTVTDQGTCLQWVQQAVQQQASPAGGPAGCSVIGWELIPNGTPTTPANDYRMVYYENGYGSSSGTCTYRDVAFDFVPNVATNTATECPPTIAASPWLGNSDLPSWLLAAKSVPSTGFNGSPITCVCQTPITLPFVWGPGQWGQHWWAFGKSCQLDTPFDMLFAAPKFRLVPGVHGPILVPTDPYSGIAEVGFQSDGTPIVLTVSSGTNGSTTNPATVNVTSAKVVDANTGADIGVTFTQQSTCPAGGAVAPCFAAPLTLTNGHYYSVEVNFSASSVAPDMGPFYLDVVAGQQTCGARTNPCSQPTFNPNAYQVSTAGNAGNLTWNFSQGLDGTYSKVPPANLCPPPPTPPTPGCTTLNPVMQDFSGVIQADLTGYFTSDADALAAGGGWVVTAMSWMLYGTNGPAYRGYDRTIVSQASLVPAAPLFDSTGKPVMGPGYGANSPLGTIQQWGSIPGAALLANGTPAQFAASGNGQLMSGVLRPGKYLLAFTATGCSGGGCGITTYRYFFSRVGWASHYVAPPPTCGTPTTPSCDN